MSMVLKSLMFIDDPDPLLVISPFMQYNEGVSKRCA